MLLDVGPDIIIDARHNGPPGTGNGGWTAGLIGARLDPGAEESAEVTLRKPPPLEVPMRVTAAAQGIEVVSPAGEMIATARPREADIPAVPSVAADEAREASKRYPGHGYHHFPTCFVCGPRRPDGLRIFPGLVDEGRTAAIFDVPAEIDQPMVWASLDCPGGWTVIDSDSPWVLGRIAAIVDELPKPGDECVVVGQVVSRQGRRALVRTSLYAPLGGLLARAEATWIRLPV
ncbi:MAG TPA: hypothetical protein VFC19_01225 [Candidatus Limnocylindrales bacterium]|nr:hypothetical protein [Candidatus Limnocylindrales bacterium]